MPKGTEIATAIPTSMTVPTIACRIPPWLSGAVGLTADMSWVKNPTWTKACQPLGEGVHHRATEREDDDGGGDVQRRRHNPFHDDVSRIRHADDAGIDQQEGDIPAQQESERPAPVQEVRVPNGDESEGRQQRAAERDPVIGGEGAELARSTLAARRDGGLATQVERLRAPPQISVAAPLRLRRMMTAAPVLTTRVIKKSTKPAVSSAES